MSALSLAGRLADERPPPQTTPMARAKPFTDEEEEKKILTDAQKDLGNTWAETLAEIAARFPGRSIPFTDEEKKIVTDAQRELGNKWTEIAERLPGRSMTQVRSWWYNRPFTDEEKKIVMDAQKDLGNRWTEIAERLPGRSTTQVRSWWYNHLSTQRERVLRNIERTRQEEERGAKRAKTESQEAKEGPLTEEERKIVNEAQRELGNKWAKIAERLPGRSRTQIQDYWHKSPHAQRQRERATHNQPRAIEGPFTDAEKKIVMDAQKELGNKWTQIAERLPGRSGFQVNSWWHNRPCVMRERVLRNSWWRNQIRLEKRKRKRRREEEGSATPGPPPKIGSKREKTESQEWKVGGMSLSEGGGAPKDDIESVDAHDASPRIGASGELDGPREEAQCVGISDQIIAQNKRQMAEPEGGGGGLRKEGPFSEEERKIVTNARRDLGNRWTKIAERLPGRSGKQVNQWWHTQIRSEKRARKRMQEEEARRVTRAKTELQEAKEGLVSEEEKRIVNDAQQEPGNKRAEIVERLPGGPAEKRRAVVDGMSDCRKGGGDQGMSHNQWMHTMRLCKMAPRGHGTSHARLANTLESQKQTIAQNEQRMAAMTNLHARQNMSRAAFEQATRTMRPNQLMLPRDRTTHKAMTDAIDQAIAQEVQHTASANDLHARTEGSTNAARTQRQNVAQEELRTAAMANLHARENINGTTFGQTIEMCLHQLALRGNGMTHEAMADAIDQAIAQEVQRTALTNNLHAP